MKEKQIQRWFKYQFIKFKRRKKLPLVIALLIISAFLAAHIFLAIQLANDSPGDSKIYSQLAKNLLEQGVYSRETESPFNPTLIRLPGYPLFLAAIYALCGHDNDLAVRVVQAIIHTATCGIVALLACNWVSNKKRRKVAAWSAFLLAAMCPFTLIYTATLLTETPTTFLMATMALTATCAFKSNTKKSLIIWWFLTGILAGTAVLLRPDSGLFAFGIGLSLVIIGLFKRSETESKFLARVWKIIWQGIIFSIAFSLPLIPWTVRNEQVFAIFQPLAPAHAEMPGEFVPHGYYNWVRTWVDDPRYIEMTLWNLGEKPIKIEKLPASAFDSEEEKTQVAALLNQYNPPPPAPKKSDDSKKSMGDKSDDNSDSDDDDADDDDKNNSDDNDKDKSDDDKDKSDNNKDDEDSDDEDQPPDANQQKPQMTPEIDAGFAEIAKQRIERAPFRYYISLPAKRAAEMWFDTHSTYYPFDGFLFPMSDLDLSANQEIWLPLFSLLVWVYTILAFVGAFFLVFDKKDRFWLLLVLLMALPRIIFFGTMENPEPRYLVEIFAFTAVLGGIALSRISFKREIGKISLEFFYGKD